ncbi:GTP-binding protein [Aeromonas caviae]|uniref:CobW family GTP-binding protein n=1 Tax=Aeromonas caviae TaxID=648 RepID=UPI00191E67E8|nr:GTP-binding protein [Aeromonas caviae]MBL0508938.1 GTP-binding protein [Aeromonas caviae]MBL0580044.1 GTP-binding protein [Aeromonas caviae]
MHSSSNLIPVTLLTGFLGSGKTTLLNHLVRQPELSDALVIINEFGEMALDHLLVAHSTENVVMEMNSGCVCCTIRGDLIKTLRDIAWRFTRNGQQQFRRVLIETTGLADPAPIVHTLMTHPQIAPHYRLDGIVTAIDLATGMHTLNEHQEAVKQAAMADTLLLTKSDLVTDEQRDAVLDRLHQLNPAAPCWLVRGGEIAAHKLLDLGLFSSSGKAADVARWLKEEAYTGTVFRPATLQKAAGPAVLGFKTTHDHLADTPVHDVNRHNDHIHAFCFAVEEPVREETLAVWLGLLMRFVGSNILRVKGIINVDGQEQPIVLHGVQHIFHPPVPLPAWPSDDRRSRLVFITRDVDRDVIEQTFQMFQQALSPARDAT